MKRNYKSFEFLAVKNISNSFQNKMHFKKKVFSSRSHANFIVKLTCSFLKSFITVWIAVISDVGQTFEQLYKSDPIQLNSIDFDRQSAKGHWSNFV